MRPQHFWRNCCCVKSRLPNENQTRISVRNGQHYLHMPKSGFVVVCGCCCCWLSDMLDNVRDPVCNRPKSLSVASRVWLNCPPNTKWYKSCCPDWNVSANGRWFFFSVCVVQMLVSFARARVCVSVCVERARAIARLLSTRNFSRCVERILLRYVYIFIILPW